MTAEFAPPRTAPRPQPTWIAEHERRAAAVADLLRHTVDALPGPGRVACRRIVDAGGKGIRPELVLRCAAVTQIRRPADSLVAAAVAVELLHLATLVHDDLIDGSDVRRGVATVHRSAGSAAAVVTGDALIAASLHLGLRSGADAAGELVTALSEMCVGQALESEIPLRPVLTADDVLDVAGRKTGALLRAACRLGARHAGLPPDDIQAFGAYGRRFGTALQVVDDVLDFVSEPSRLGKPVQADLAAGTFTLPAVLALAADASDPSDPSDRRAVPRPSAGLDAAQRRELGDRVVTSGALVAAAARSAELARAAGAALSGVGGDPGLVDALSAMPLQYVRDHLDRHVAGRHREAIARAVR
ncbi:MAG: polyprenyl synthetase family protein [bacterium]